MICYQPVFSVCLILVGFNSHLTCAVSETVGPFSVAQVSRVCPEDQLKWTPSETSDFAAADKLIESGSLDACKKRCKRRDGCVAVKYNQRKEKCLVILHQLTQYEDTRIADTQKNSETVHHVLVCKGKSDDVRQVLSSLSV
ncbi:hypothetical protein EG68_00455 [Paragonimus skrjabini miyazakii]|uniref:Apple domain-containing protein n=1 Tax=Paragonimus skrjabini miyazakii TaxID=59628 RepID=A0A8S9Z935_9TREM|nr:hypothetical protein EG68_00455 [Paragonimus skrjabini miyazakii]